MTGVPGEAWTAGVTDAELVMRGHHPDNGHRLDSVVEFAAMMLPEALRHSPEGTRILGYVAALGAMAIRDPGFGVDYVRTMTPPTGGTED